MEYDGTYEYRRECAGRAGKGKVFIAEPLPGMSAVFAEKGKRYRGQAVFALLEIIFSKESFSLEEADAVWSKYEVRYLPGNLMNRKYPRILSIAGPGGIPFSGYVAVLERGPKQGTLKAQLAEIRG